MADYLSINEWPSDGAKTEYELSFAGGYLSKDDIDLFVYGPDGVQVVTYTFIWVGDNQVSLSSAPPAGYIVRFERNSPYAGPVVDFSDGSVINETTLDVNAKQAIFLAAELRDRYGANVDIGQIGASLVEMRNLEAQTTANAVSAAASATAASTTINTLTTSAGALGVGANDGASGSLFSTVQGFITQALNKLFKRDIDPMDAPYNAVGNGLTDDFIAFRAADIAAAAKGLPLRITGRHKLGTDYAPVSTIQWAGGVILPASGKTLTVNGLMAPPVKVFDITLGGTATFAGATIPLHAFAEWWGAVCGDTTKGAINTVAINAATAAHHDVRLLAGRYTTSDTIVVDRMNHKLRGAGFNAFNETDGFTGLTAILSTSATATILQYGPVTEPAGFPNSFPQGVEVSGLFLGRTVAPNIASACVGLNANYVIGGAIYNIKSHNSIVSFRMGGLLTGDVSRIYGTRDNVGAGSGTDQWIGCEFNGNVDVGTIGSNASLHVWFSNMTCNIAALQTAALGSIGYRLYGNAEDLFLHDPESDTCNIGILVEGGGTNADISMDHPIMDASFQAGIYLRNVSPGGAINIVNPYCAPQVGPGIVFDGCVGPVGVLGGQVLMSASTGPGIKALGTSMASVKSTIVQANTLGDCVQVAGCKSCEIDVIVANNTGTDSGHNVIVINELAGVAATACTFKAQVGGTNRFNGGIIVDGTVADVRNNYHVGGINSDNITGGYVNKLVRNGTSALTSPTMLPFNAGTNQVSGCTG